MEDLRRLDAHYRSSVKDAMERHLREEPTRVSKSRIKHLRGIRRPRYRLRVGDIRVFYDVSEGVVEVLARYLRIAEREEVVITPHGKPAGILIGFQSEEAWFDYRLENDRRFLRRIESARRSLRAGRGVPLERLDET